MQNLKTSANKRNSTSQGEGQRRKIENTYATNGENWNWNYSGSLTKKKIKWKQIRHSEGERFRLKELEYQKKIEDAQKANEDLRRKLEQGSQQLQGEVFELELENIIKNAFPFDIVEEIRKGVRGADVLQTVITRTGQICGKIIWEAKRAVKIGQTIGSQNLRMISGKQMQNWPSW